MAVERLLFNWFANSSHYPVHNVYIAFVALVMTTKLCSTMFVRVRYLLEVNFSIGLYPFSPSARNSFHCQDRLNHKLSKTSAMFRNQFWLTYFLTHFLYRFQISQNNDGHFIRRLKTYTYDASTLRTKSFFHKGSMMEFKLTFSFLTIVPSTEILLISATET